MASASAQAAALSAEQAKGEQQGVLVPGAACRGGCRRRLAARWACSAGNGARGTSLLPLSGVRGRVYRGTTASAR